MADNPEPTTRWPLATCLTETTERAFVMPAATMALTRASAEDMEKRTTWNVAPLARSEHGHSILC